MTQFILVTPNGTKEPIRLNVAAISHYSQNAGDLGIEINLINGGILRVAEDAPALDGLIRNLGKGAVISEG
jgi:hypothetical protein